MKKQIKKLTIAILDFDDLKNPLLGAGQARATYEVGRRLAKKGHTVIVLASRYPGYIDRTEDGITYKHIGLGSKFVRINNFVYFAAIPLALRNLKADIVLECFTAPISTLFGPVFTKIPVVAIPTIFAADQFSRKYHLPLHLIERFGVRFYKYFIAYTKDIEQKMKSMNPSITSKVVAQGVGREYLTLKQEKPEYILFLGRFDMDQKGIDLLLYSFAKIAKKIKYPLVLAGHGPDEKKIREIIKKQRIQKYVRFIGPTYGEKKLRTLAKALFVAFPSRHDDLPLFSLEAIASGLPLISFDLQELAWASRSFSLKALPYDTDDYARLLKFACENKEIHSMRKAARTYAKRFSWDKVANAYEKFFLEVYQKEAKNYGK